MKPLRVRPAMPPPPLNTREAAEVLGIHVNTLKRWRAIPFFRVGTRGDRRYEMADVMHARTYYEAGADMRERR